MLRPNGKLIIGGQEFQIDAPLVNWYDSGWDATSERCIPTRTEPRPRCAQTGARQVPYGSLPVPYTKRYAVRPSLRSWPKSDGGRHPSYEAVKAVVKQFVVHHDGCASADMCFNVLQNERGLSAHFLIDSDGTIYQTIDLGLMAYHASDWNLYSIGVELCNRGDAYNVPDYYDGGKHGPRREIKPCKINGNTIKAFDYTPAQLDAFSRLCRELLRLLPNLPAEYPQASPGEPMWGTLKDAAIKRESYAGYVGHYHINTHKWDPGPFDFKGFCGRLRGALCFPVFPRLEPRPGQDKPVVPDKTEELRQDVKALYGLNEDKADGGFFPIGPWGKAALWHGGIHVVGKRDGGVFAPYPGRLVAARMGRDSAIGSFNFVLLRHEMTLGARRVQFYSLYMHLADETRRGAPAAWMTKDAWRAHYKRGAVVLLDEPIEAGALIGHVGVVGPVTQDGDLSRAQVHLEFFSEQLIDDPYWQLVDGTAGGRFCDLPEILDPVDQDKDRVVSREELTEFFASGGGDSTHPLVTLHVSEWIAEPDWVEALKTSKGFADMRPDEIEAMVADQIAPGLWWDARVAKHCRLPPDGVVHHYHPVAFMSWFKNQLIDAAVEAARNGHKVDERDVREVPKSITDDFGDRDGSSMRSTDDITEDPCNKSLTLEQMVQGYDAPECSQ